MYVDKEGQVFNHFLDMVSMDDGKADTVVAAVKEVLQKKEIQKARLYGLGTDGAAVMTGIEIISNSYFLHFDILFLIFPQRYGE